MQSSDELIRLVVWDLDGTFWNGTVTEGGHEWREDAARAVRVLATRGIVSAICSKNDPDRIAAILREQDFEDFFVFNSISWEAKGPRLALLIAAIQLRPESILFIDDNAANRAEAVHFVPGLQVADETIIPGLLSDPRCRGKDDPGMTRLAQYRMLDRRHRDRLQATGDTTEFLRNSRITVSIEHDLGKHADRVIELINRTNQLNFTKQRLPEDADSAGDVLARLLSDHNVQAGLLRVSDRYGDHGYCGLYILRNHRRHGRSLVHFAFSCRILGMGVETWLYRRLGRPALAVAGPVLTDVTSDDRVIDWIDTGIGNTVTVRAGEARPLKYVLARGGCDMRAISHYFGMVAERVIEEFDTVRDGEMPLVNHTLIAIQAIEGIDERAVADFHLLGFRKEDFHTILAGDLPPGPAVWLFGFAIEAKLPIFRHKATGALLPAFLLGLGVGGDAGKIMRDEPYTGGVDPLIVAHLKSGFTYEGPVSNAAFKDTLRKIFARATVDVRVFIMLANTRAVLPDRREFVARNLDDQNIAIGEVAADFPNVELLAPLDFMSADEIASLRTPHHYDRMVYFRIFTHIMERLNCEAGQGKAPAP